MGNRAIVNLKYENTVSPCSIYLHWNGGPSSVWAFHAAVRDFMKKHRGADLDYYIARFVQTVGHFFGGAHSIGVVPYTLVSPGDNGVYNIDITEETPQELSDTEHFQDIYKYCMEYLNSTTYEARRATRKA